ncbi:unnamed protein product [Ranitomeya imitator]|uniref:NTR domain-containing protein n=1 Tax=Ranitomeya imitator TaxID=111125 RepID=A0ABN9LU06_9NEOB|nr:unnamed protein product [Ranitomeya imitator]
MHEHFSRLTVDERTDSGEIFELEATGGRKSLDVLFEGQGRVKGYSEAADFRYGGKRDVTSIPEIDQLQQIIEVLRMRIKEVKIENGDLKLIAAQKKKKVLKAGKLKRKEFRKLVLYIKNAVECQCPQLDNLSGSFLIMGRKVEK